MKLLKLLAAWRTLLKVQFVVDRVSGGLLKRLDENRELLEVLERDVPDFMAKHPWVRGWLLAQDEFLQALQKSVAPQRPLLGPSREFPRPWPASTPEIIETERLARIDLSGGTP